MEKNTWLLPMYATIGIKNILTFAVSSPVQKLRDNDMSGVKLQMGMSLIRINGPWGVENTPLVTEIWHLKCKQVL